MPIGEGTNILEWSAEGKRVVELKTGGRRSHFNNTPPHPSLQIKPAVTDEEVCY